jgi:hypothetical protein
MADDTPPTTQTIKPLVLNTVKTSQPIVTANGLPAPSFAQTINNAFDNIIVSFNAVAALAGNADALAQQVSDLVQQLLDIQGLVVDIDGKLTSAAITSSYTSPVSVMTATTTAGSSAITIAAHTRIYTDGVTVAVDGGTISGLAPGQTYYVYYSDPARHGGAVTYQQSSDASDAAQVGGIHSLGSVDTPATDGSSGGGGTVPPGTGGPRPPNEHLP